MRSVAGFTLSYVSVFLGVVALLIGAPALFYMATALIATIVACHFQAKLAVNNLRFERVAPKQVRVGDKVTVEMTVWSERKIRRPLITISDNLPPKLLVSYLSASLPVAPAYDLPVRTQYQFRPAKRGVYRWKGMVVEGTDALGLVTKRKEYETEDAELRVLPNPAPLSVELPIISGWGITEADTGQAKGAGMEPRGIRGYVAGDPIRHIHWRSSARAQTLLVKEFEAGSQATAAFFIQETSGTEVGEGPRTTLEAMCSHVAFLAEQYLRQGVRIELPMHLELAVKDSASERIQLIEERLTEVQAERSASLAADILGCARQLAPGTTVFALAALADPELPVAASQLKGYGGQFIVLLYDPRDYSAKGAAWRGMAATDPAYIEQLRVAGAYPVVVPSDGIKRPETKSRWGSRLKEVTA